MSSRAAIHPRAHRAASAPTRVCATSRELDAAAVLRALLSAATPAYAAHNRARRRREGEDAAAALAAAVHLASADQQIAGLLVEHMLAPGRIPAAVECALTSGVVAAHLGMGGRHLRDLALAALLCDIGMARLPATLVRKPGLLGAGERERVQAHVHLGLELLEPVTRRFPLVGRVAAEHHEQVDGRGYPQGLRGGQVCQEAQCVAVAQRYLAAVTARPQRPAIAPHDALELIMTLTGGLASARVVTAFSEAVAIYPAGCLVKLSDGRIGRVIGAGQLASRPAIDVLWGADGELLGAPERVALLSHRTLFIEALA